MDTLPHRSGFRFLNIGLHIRSDSEELLRFFQDSYQRFRTTAPTEHEFSVQTRLNGSPWRGTFRSRSYECGVLKTGQGFVFCRRDRKTDSEELILFSNGQQQPISHADALDSAETDHTPEDNEHLFSFAQTALLNTLARLLPEHHLFHAAALTWQESGLILSGTSGQGKSSLSLALIKHGCKFLSDDIACVDPARNQLEPFARKLNLRQRGLPILNRLLPKKEIIPGSTDMEEIFPDSIGGPAPLRCLFLLRGFADQATIRPVPQHQALLEALQNSHTLVQQPAQALLRFAPLFSRMRCYELLAGDLDTTAALICNRMEADADR